MACYRPFSASLGKGGDVAFHDRPGDRGLRLPCGRCVGCRMDYALSWSIRCQHEAALYLQNSFVTLTYDDAYLPPDQSLRYPDVQKFLKLLRWRMSPRRLRFFCAGEYGTLNDRPHYHLLLFNFDFSDKKKIGKQIFESAELSDLWPYGFASCGDVTPQSAAYVSRYSLKKVYGRVASESHYLDADTGSVRRAEFCTMSRRPGIGAGWYRRYEKDFFPSDYVVVNGRKLRVPRFYSKMFEEDHPSEFADVVEERERAVLDMPVGERMPDRLAVKEKVREFNVKFFHERKL